MMITAKLKITRLNSDKDANYLLRMLQEAWELEVQYLLTISHDHPKDGHRKWKVKGGHRVLPISCAALTKKAA